MTIPPKSFGTLPKKFKKLSKLKFKKLIYLSSTSVVETQRSWVHENSKLKPTVLIGKRRVQAEKQWKIFGKKYNLDINILRIAGIYSKENNTLRKIKISKKYVKEKKFFSRIRIEDLVRIIERTLKNKNKNMILNAADDKPSTNVEVAKYASRLLKLKILMQYQFQNLK